MRVRALAITQQAFASSLPRARRMLLETPVNVVAAGNRCLVTGDMGIANTTPSAARVLRDVATFDSAGVSGAKD